MVRADVSPGALSHHSVIGVRLMVWQHLRPVENLQSLARISSAVVYVIEMSTRAGGIIAPSEST